MAIQNPIDLRKVNKATAEKYLAEGLFDGYTADDIVALSKSADGSKELQKSVASIGRERLQQIGYDGIWNKVRSDIGKKSAQEGIS